MIPLATHDAVKQHLRRGNRVAIAHIPDCAPWRAQTAFGGIPVGPPLSKVKWDSLLPMTLNTVDDSDPVALRTVTTKHDYYRYFSGTARDERNKSVILKRIKERLLELQVLIEQNMPLTFKSTARGDLLFLRKNSYSQ